MIQSTRGETGSTGGLLSPNRDRKDRRIIFDRIAKSKSAIPDSDLTPLNINRSHILAIMEQNHLRRVPSRMAGRREKGNSNFYCAYHWDIGYENEDCNDLKKDIEDLIKRGYLRQFIRRDGERNKGDTCSDHRGKQRRENKQGGLPEIDLLAVGQVTGRT